MPPPWRRLWLSRIKLSKGVSGPKPTTDCLSGLNQILCVFRPTDRRYEPLGIFSRAHAVQVGHCKPEQDLPFRGDPTPDIISGSIPRGVLFSLFALRHPASLPAVDPASKARGEQAKRQGYALGEVTKNHPHGNPWGVGAGDKPARLRSEEQERGKTKKAGDSHGNQRGSSPPAPQATLRRNQRTTLSKDAAGIRAVSKTPSVA